MLSFRMGGKVPSEFPDVEGGRLIFLGGTVVFAVGLIRPTSLEVDVMNDRQLTIGVAEYERLGVLLFEYDGGLTFEPTFDVGIERNENIPKYTFSSISDRIPIAIIAYDIRSRRIFTIRYCSLSPAASRVFANITEKQAVSRIDRVEHYVRVNNLYSRVSCFDSMKKIALVMDCVG